MAEVVAGKGHHKTKTLAWLGERDIRTYVAPRRDKRKRRWDDKPDGWREAVYENLGEPDARRANNYSDTEPMWSNAAFALVCTTGGARRSWIRGPAEVGKRSLVTVIAHNLGVILRALIGLGKPREWASMRALIAASRRFSSTIVQLALDAMRWIDGRLLSSPVLVPASHDRFQ